MLNMQTRSPAVAKKGRLYAGVQRPANASERSVLFKGK